MLCVFGFAGSAPAVTKRTATWWVERPRRHPSVIVADVVRDRSAVV